MSSSRNCFKPLRLTILHKLSNSGFIMFGITRWIWCLEALGHASKVNLNPAGEMRKRWAADRGGRAFPAFDSG
jgi:hypothetical protein